MVHRRECGGSMPFLSLLRALPVALAVVVCALGARAAEPDLRVLEDSGDRIVLELMVDGPTFSPVLVGGQSLVEVQLGGEAVLKREGEPELPRVSRSLIVPDDANLTVRVLEAESYLLEDVDVVPSRGILSRQIDPTTVPRIFGPVYDQDAAYPGTLAELREPYIMRDHRGVVVDLYPLQLNPAQRTLEVVERLVVEISRVGGSEVPANVLGPRDRAPSLAFEQLYEHHFLNWPSHAPQYPPITEDGELLIICHDAWLGEVQPLVAHKNGIGIPTTAVGVSSVGNSEGAIAGHIEDAYHAGNLAFVLLVGDHSHVATPNANGSAADPTYATVSGNDSYPDLLIGRFSADSAADVATQVARTIEYETLPATLQPWFLRGVGLASTEGPGDDGEMDHEHLANIRDDMLAYGYTEVDEFYGDPVSAGMITTAVNDGRGIVNYCGHGWDEGWVTGNFSNSHVNALTNEGMLPFVLTVGCNVGEFNHGTCFAEAWLRATHGGIATGAIAFYGSTISQSWSPPMSAQDEFNELLVAEAHVSFGALAFAGSSRMIDDYAGSGENEYIYWTIFGDPSVRVHGVATPVSGLRVDPYDGLEAEGHAGGPFDPAEKLYTLENPGDTALDYQVLNSRPWVSIDGASGTLQPGETAAVRVSFGPDASGLGNGHYEDLLEFVNLTDGEGDTTRELILDVGIPEAQYEWTLNDDPGWTTEGEWALGQPIGLGGEHGCTDPSGGYTGTQVYGYNLSGDYPDGLAEKHLTTGAIDCTNLTRTSLKFWRWLGVEDSEYDHASVRVSTDGSSWSTVWQNSGEVADGEWVRQQVDLQAIADGQPTVHVRWTMGSTDEGWRYCGWNLDDVQIWGLGDPGCGDADGDGYSDAGCGGDDCDDAAYDVHPNVGEDCGDGLDNDCDGAVDGADEECGGTGDDDDDAGLDDDVSLGAGDCSCRQHGDPRSRSAVSVLLLALGLAARRRRVLPRR